LAGFLLAACAAAGPQSGQVVERDTIYDTLNAGEIVLARQAVQEALETRPSNETYRWDSGDGSYGSVMPTRTFRIKSGHYCRDYMETLAKDSERVSTSRTACRDSQGAWRVVKP
jgi:surface antigen